MIPSMVVRLLALSSAIAFAGSIMAQTVTLTFEGLQDGEPVLNYYNGGKGGLESGPGPNYGIAFGSDAIAGIALAAGGSGNFSGNPSGNTIVTFLSGPGVVMNVPAGFKTGFSFYYASATNAGTITVYDNVNATGNLLATLQLAATGTNCNNSIYDFSCWVSKGVTFSGTAKSVNFSGVTNGIGFDNITLGSSTPGASGPLTILTTSLPGATVNTTYNVTLAASGGKTPYSWSASGLPNGLTLNSSTGTIGGTPTVAGTFNIAVTATDSSTPKGSATRTLSLTIAQGLVMTTSSLPSGVVSSAYTASLAATGGKTPYSWAASGLPSGLVLNASSGVISGTPTSGGTFTVSVTVTDSSSPKLSATKTYALTITSSSNSVTGVQITPATITSITDRPIITITLASPAAAQITATLVLSFVPNAAALPANYTNRDVQFGLGGTTTNVTINQNTRSVSLPANDSIQIGSVAGTIAVTLTRLTQLVNGQQQAMTLPNPLPSVSIVVPKLAPVISSVRIINATTSGFTIDVVASSTPRDLAGASFAFTPASGAQLSGTSFAISGNANPLSSTATSWFASANGQTSGGAFDVQIPFTYSGDITAIGSVSVQLSNSVGSSAAVAGTR